MKLSENEYVKKVREYACGRTPLFSEGDTVIVKENIPTHATVGSGLYGCAGGYGGKTQTITKVSKTTLFGVRYWTYHCKPAGWYYLECDLMHDHPQMGLFTKEVYDASKS